MKTANSSIRLLLGVALIAGLAACGGGGGGHEDVPGRKTGVTVDPYIVGAVLREVTTAGAVVQESSASDAQGAFAFEKSLTPGNRVLTAVKGFHNGIPYAVALSGLVEADYPLVVSPLTTLFASGAYSREQVAAMANLMITDTDPITADDVRTDPMARMLDGDVTAVDRRLLAANLAVGAALAIRHGDTSRNELTELVTAIAPKLVAALSANGSPQAVASAASAIADYIVSVSTTAAEATSASSAITDLLISQLVVTATGGDFAAILSSGGTLQAGTQTINVADLLAKGRAALERFATSQRTDDLLEATNAFSAAATLASGDATATPAQKDEANFFSGLARVAALIQPYSDATGNGLNDFGDLLDAYGMGGTNADRKSLTSYLFLDCPADATCTLKSIPASAPHGRALQSFVASQVMAGLRAAIARFDQVGTGFGSVLTVGKESVELDATDVQVAKAFAQSMLAAIEVQYAYDLDVDLASLETKLESQGGGESQPAPGPAVAKLAKLVSAPARALAGETARYDMEAFLAEYPNVGKLVDAPLLQSARTDGVAACDSALRALDLLGAETDDQSDDFFHLGHERCSWDEALQKYVCTLVDVAKQLADVRTQVEQVRSMLSASGNYTFDMGSSDSSDDVTVNASKFFAGIDLRAMLPSTFHAGAHGDAPGKLPDSTFGGVLVKSPIDLTTDGDGDGAPDVFE